MAIIPQKQLKDYFSKREDVCLAFLFGSRATDRVRATSDWDIGVYFTPKRWAELETKIEYPGEKEIRSDLDRICATEVDLVVLNRARPQLVFHVMNSGKPFVIKDQNLYLKLLLKTHYEAVDFWQFIDSFWEIRKNSASLTPQARALLIEHVTFLENEFADLKKFQKFTWKEYMENRDHRRNMERWIENLVMNALDIAKIILAAEKKEVPQTYRESLRMLGALYFDTPFAEQLSEIADMRNIVTHEYLDIRWERIQKFIKEAAILFPKFIKRVGEIIS